MPKSFNGTNFLLITSFLIIFSSSFVSAIPTDSGSPLTHTIATNYSEVNVNNSEYWDGNAWDNDRWVFTSGDTMTGILNMGSNVVRFTGGDIKGDGTTSSTWKIQSAGTGDATLSFDRDGTRTLQYSTVSSKFFLSHGLTMAGSSNIQGTLGLSYPGVAKTDTDFITLTNSRSIEDNDGTGTGIKFKQYDYEFHVSPTSRDAGRIVVKTENDWNTTATTRDSQMSFAIARDGVLIDAVDLHQKAFIEAVRPYKEIDENYHMKYLNGIPTKKKLEKLGFNTDLIEEINCKKQEATFKLIKEIINPIEVVTNVIMEIKKRKIPFAVCSNSIRKSIELFLEYANIDGEEFIISNQDVINPKPDPEMYLKAMQLLQFSKEEILIVEDSPVGIQAAQAAGGILCKVANPYDLNKVINMLDELNK